MAALRKRQRQETVAFVVVLRDMEVVCGGDVGK